MGERVGATGLKKGPHQRQELQSWSRERELLMLLLLLLAAGGQDVVVVVVVRAR